MGTGVGSPEGLPLMCLVPGLEGGQLGEVTSPW